MIFGIESTYPSNGKLTNGYRLFDWVMRKQDVPRFWLRGITGEYGVTREEMAFLKANGCRTAFGSERPYGADRIAKRSRAGSAARARSLATAAGTLVFGDCAFCALCAELEHEPQLDAQLRVYAVRKRIHSGLYRQHRLVKALLLRSGMRPLQARVRSGQPFRRAVRCDRTGIRRPAGKLDTVLSLRLYAERYVALGDGRPCRFAETSAPTSFMCATKPYANIFCSFCSPFYRKRHMLCGYLPIRTGTV